MEPQIVTAAKWFTVALVTASLILVSGAYFIVSDSTAQLSKALVNAGIQSRSHSSGGGRQLQYFENQLQLAPVELHVKQVK